MVSSFAVSWKNSKRPTGLRSLRVVQGLVRVPRVLTALRNTSSVSGSSISDTYHTWVGKVRQSSPVRRPATATHSLTPCLFLFILFVIFFFLFSSRPHLPGLCVKQPCRLCYAGDADRPVDGATRGLRISPPWMRMPLLLLLHAQQRIAARVESGCV